MVVNQVAIVGLGSIGRRHLRILKGMRPEIEVTLIRSGKGQDWPEKNLARRTVPSIEEAIQVGITAAIISSPASMHISQAIELAKAGVHLLIEKPLSHNLKGVNEFLSEEETGGVVCLMGYVLRHDPAAKKFKEILEEGRTGQLLHARVECGSYLPDWRPQQDYHESVSASAELGGGVLLELSHELDHIRWILGNITSLYAHLQNSGTLGIEVEESADLILINEDDLPISVHLDFNSRHPIRCSKVHGTEGELTWDAIHKKVIWYPTVGEPQVESFDFEQEFIYLEQLNHFLDCIENGTPPVVTLEDGAATLRLVEAAKQSHATRHRLVLT